MCQALPSWEASTESGDKSVTGTLTPLLTLTVTGQLLTPPLTLIRELTTLSSLFLDP